MRRHLRVARRLHLGARRRRRCRSGPLLCRGRVRYAGERARPARPPTRLPSPVGRPTLGRPRIGAVGLPVSLSPPLARALTAARAHRRARRAEHADPTTPTTPPKPTVQAPLLLLGAAGRPRRPCACFHAAARFYALAAKARVTRPGPSPSPSTRSTSPTPRRRSSRHTPGTSQKRAVATGSRQATGPPQAVTSFQSPPSTPLGPPAPWRVARATCSAVTTTM
jgi:hypothetical protein